MKRCIPLLLFLFLFLCPGTAIPAPRESLQNPLAADFQVLNNAKGERR